MPRCSFCGDSFFKVNSLITHLKIIHHCQNNSLFICGEQHCTRHFPSLNSYRKHLKVHNTTVSSNNHQTIRNIPVSENKNENDLPQHNTHLAVTEQIEKLPLPDCDINITAPFAKFKDALTTNSISFICNLYSETSFTRNDVQKVLDTVSELLCEPLKIFEEHVISNVFNAEEHNITQYFEELQHIFNGFSSEYLRFKFLEQSGFYVSPVEYVVGQRLEKCGKSAPIQKNYTAQYIPITEVLKRFLELPNVLFQITEYMEQLKNEFAISNIVQTKFWQEKVSHFEKSAIVLPLFFYYDDYESGNPLGSHSGIHKIGAVYYTVPCIPPPYQAHLENIFLAILFHSSDLKDFGGDVIFSKLVDELNELKQSGVKINLPSGNAHIYFCVALFLGDNLAQNTILGFQESFSSNSFCRFCKCLKIETQKNCVEVHSALRNIANYNEDLASNNAFLTGIKFSPILNNIDLFHVTQNYAVDIAHDIFEGMGVTVMSHLLYRFVVIDKYVSLDILNNKIKYFDYNSNHNKPPVITFDNLKNKKLRMSAAEMKTFILNVGLLIGHYIPEGDAYWKLYILLRKILKIILSESVTPNMFCQLGSLIKEHHSLYLKLFSQPLTPKFHLVTHYECILRTVGPLTRISTLRYESKHRQSKQAANVIASRINITKSLAIKHQLQLASRFAKKIGFLNTISYSCSVKQDLGIFAIIPNFEKILIQSGLSMNVSQLELFEENVIKVQRLKLNNKIFRAKDIVIVDNERNLPIFGCIENIILNNDKDVCFIYSEIRAIDFNEHIFAYEVRCTSVKKCVFWTDCQLGSPFMDTLMIVLRNNKKFINNC